MDDADLLRQYTLTGAPDALGELAQRHGPMVYGAAYRQVGGDPHLAEDVTQAVFLLLARKARSVSIPPGRCAAGWLYTATHYAAKDALRAARRRLRHERQAAAARPEADMPVTDDPWSEIAPLLDPAMAKLRETDRQLVLLHYFQNRSLAEVSAALGIRPNTASKRLSRAIDRLRREFARRGLLAPSAVVAATIALHAARPGVVPALSASSPSAGVAAIAAGTHSVLVLIKLKTIAAALAAAFVVSSLTAIAVLHPFEAARPATPLRANSVSKPNLQANAGQVQNDDIHKLRDVLSTARLAQIGAESNWESAKLAHDDPDKLQQMAGTQVVSQLDPEGLTLRSQLRDIELQLAILARKGYGPNSPIVTQDHALADEMKQRITAADAKFADAYLGVLYQQKVEADGKVEEYKRQLDTQMADFDKSNMSAPR